MNFEKRPMTDREYLELIYSFLTEMNGALMAQVRMINNSIAKILAAMIDIQNNINILNAGLKETRDRRYQEEIDLLEEQLGGLKKQIEEKKSAKQDNLTTSQEIRAIALDIVTEQREEEIKKWRINWPDIWQKIVLVIITTIVIYSLPAIGRFLASVFSP